MIENNILIPSLLKKRLCWWHIKKSYATEIKWGQIISNFPNVINELKAWVDHDNLKFREATYVKIIKTYSKKIDNVEYQSQMFFDLLFLQINKLKLIASFCYVILVFLPVRMCTHTKDLNILNSSIPRFISILLVPAFTSFSWNHYKAYVW